MRRPTAAAFALLCSATALFGPTFTRAADGPSAGASPVSDADVRLFRSTFGLSTEASVLSAARDEDTAPYLYGVPLTANERSELDARVNRERSYGTFVGSMSKQAGYAGTYVDQARGGMWVVQFTGDGGPVNSAMPLTLPSGVPAITRAVDFSAADLDATRAKVEADYVDLAEELGVSYLAVDERVNRVVIGLSIFNAGAAAALVERYGASVQVVSQPIDVINACTRTSCGTPSMKGGLVITSKKSPVDPSIGCTSGFGAKKSSGTPANTWYFLTAGHCLYYGGGAWSHTGIGAFGTPVIYQYCDRCQADTGVLKMLEWHTPTNLVFAVDSTDIRSVIGKRSNTDQGLGIAVCRVGGASNNVRCGTIVGRELSVTLHDDRENRDVIYNHTWKMNTDSITGNSGGPIINSSRPGTYAFGTLVGGGAASTYYSTIDYIRASVGYEPCVTASTNPCL